MKYEITKEQVLQNYKNGLKYQDYVSAANLKEWFPDAFKKDMEVGKWYKGTADIEFLVYYQSNGFDNYGFWEDQPYRDNLLFGDCWYNMSRLATDEEVEAALKKEAKKRGYKQGITCAFGKGAYNRIISENEIRWVPDWQDKGALCMGMNVIFTQGNWAEILHQEKTVVPMEKALKIIAKKMKVSPENIEIQY